MFLRKYTVRSEKKRKKKLNSNLNFKGNETINEKCYTFEIKDGKKIHKLCE